MDMTNRIFLNILVLLSGTGLLQAQPTGYTLGDFSKTFLGSQYGKISDVRSEINGSPYENDLFVSGEVFTSMQLHYTGIPLRYNIYADQMEFKNPDGGIFEFSRPELIDSIVIGTSKYMYAAFMTGSKTQKGYFKVLTGGTPALLLKMNTILKPAESAALYKDAVPASFERTQNKFFLLFPLKEAVRFSDKKDFLKILNSFQAEMDQFIKKNKIRFNKQEDLVVLMNYYSSLGK
jgi:hypothetical protein